MSNQAKTATTISTKPNTLFVLMAKWVVIKCHENNEFIPFLYQH